jgi:hypothetical protein
MLPDPRIMLAATVAILATIVALGLGSLDALRHHADKEWAGSIGGLRPGLGSGLGSSLGPNLAEASASPAMSQLALSRRMAELRSLRELVSKEENAIADPPVQPAAVIVETSAATESAALVTPAETPVTAVTRSDQTPAEGAPDQPAATSAVESAPAEVAAGSAAPQSGPTLPAAAPATQQAALTDPQELVAAPAKDAKDKPQSVHAAQDKAAKVRAAAKSKRKIVRARRAQRTVQATAPAAAPSNNFFLFGNTPTPPSTARR